MNLSNGEKLILVMLSEVYKHHKIKGEIDPEFVLKTIFNDYAWGLRWQYPGIFNSADDNPPEVDETCAILNMYRLLTSSYEKLSKKDKDRVQAEADPYGDYVEYQGFDGNNDKHLGIVSFLVKELGRYDELEGKEDLNSHSVATLQQYRRMLEVFNSIIEPGYPTNGLTADQIIQILKGGQ